MRSVNMLDLGAEFALYGDAVREAIECVFRDQWFVGGPPVAALESALSRRIGASEAIAISSGTDALLAAMMALGIGAGDEVILPTFTFFATAGSVFRLGAKPVFVDIDPRTYNIDVAEIEKAVTKKTKAIVAVHLFGQCADMDSINELAKRHSVPVIEDAAQAIGATYHGRFAGALGDVACFSFYPTKNLGGCGEGGMILTNDKELAEVVRQMRNHGQTGLYDHAIVGGNFRLDSIKAAVLSAKLGFFDDLTQRRQKNAARYGELLNDLPITLPFVPEGHEPVYHQYTVRCDERDALRAFLKDRGVGTGVFYPIPLHLQKCFASVGYQVGACPVAEKASEQVLSLPCHPMLSEDDTAYVASCIREFFSGQRGDGAVAAASQGGQAS